MRGIFKKTGINFCGNSTGGALIAALLLVAISAIMGATILVATSTDLQISGNFRRAVKSFYIAEAGIAETLNRLGRLSYNSPEPLSDPFPTSQPNWLAYVISGNNWGPQDDVEYSTFFTNYFPMSGNATNKVIVLNSIQTVLPYWSKIHHKTEFDAESAGHTSLTPHYQDIDGITTFHSKNNRGNIIFYGFPSGTILSPTPFTSASPTPYSPVEIIISQSEVEGALSRIRVEAAHPAGPPLLAPVYAQNQLILAGGSATIQGFDDCGLLPEGRPPVQLGPAGALVGNPTLIGNPPVAQVGMEALDLLKSLENLRPGAQINTDDIVEVSGSGPGNPALIYAEVKSGVSNLTAQNIYGFGILLVKGNLSILAPFRWEGIIIVSGQVTFDGGLGTSVIQGALFADQVTILSGDVTITLDSCPIAASLRVLPVIILTWQQLL